MAKGKRVTISDIAARAGVSIGAVSFALNGRKGVSEETRERVLKVAAEMGWVPSAAARSLAEAKTETFGMVLARNPKVLGVETYYMQFIAGLETELSTRGYSLLLQFVPNRDEEIKTLNKWRNSRRVDGVLLVDLTVDDPRVPLLAETADTMPALVIGDPSVAGDLACVWTDDASSMREAVRHLAEFGHRKVARVSGLSRFAHTSIRDEEFLKESEKLGLDPIIARTDYTPDNGADVTRELLISDAPPTALIYDNDVMAVAGLTVALELGISIPEQLSIIAWDDSILCEHTFPRLTALSHDVVASGEHAGRRLFELIDGVAPAAHLDYTPRLIARNSTGPAPEAR